MSLTRRGFVHTLGAGTASSLLAPYLSFPGPEPFDASSRSTGAIRLDRNENPNGPAKEALDGIVAAFADASRYPDEAPLLHALAEARGVSEHNIVLTCGSTDVIRSAVYAFTSPSRALVAGLPSFESAGQDAQRVGSPVRNVLVTAELELDLTAMAEASRGAGLVYICNPNNPTATVAGADAIHSCVARILGDTPDATVLIDEAYHDYVDDPSYATMIPLALENPRVVVSRTFSKVFGMAGLRVGYAVAQPETIDAIRRQRLTTGVNRLGAAAAVASVGLKSHIEREHARNRDAREFTRRELAAAGYPCVPSHTNFIMVNVRRDAHEFQDACRAQGVLIGRPFPPLTTYARISIGTMDEMHRAMDVLRNVLRSGPGQPHDA
jgi:histidinol-phosphate aminotransferase